MTRELARFFALVERLAAGGAGGAQVSARIVRATASEAACAALVNERIVVTGVRAESVACAHRAGCEREIREAREGASAGRRFLAVCGQTPPECDAEWVDAAELETLRVDVGGIVRVVRRVFGVRGGPRLVARGESAEREPIALGMQEAERPGETTRDAFLATRPEAQLGATWIALRERAARGAVVFVPTAAGVGADRMARHGSADRVEIVALEDALGVGNGAIVGIARRRETAAESVADVEELGPRRGPLTKTRGLELPPVKTWRELGVCLLDGETVRFDGAGKYVRCSFHDLGLSSKQNRKATRAWDVLVRTCVGEGRFDHRKFDRRWDVARRHVSDLGRRMQTLFGIDEVPFEAPKGGEYRAKFRAREGVPEGMG